MSRRGTRQLDAGTGVLRVDETSGLRRAKMRGETERRDQGEMEQRNPRRHHLNGAARWLQLGMTTSLCQSIAIAIAVSISVVIIVICIVSVVVVIIVVIALLESDWVSKESKKTHLMTGWWEHHQPGHTSSPFHVVTRLCRVSSMLGVVSVEVGSPSSHSVTRCHAVHSRVV